MPDDEDDYEYTHFDDEAFGGDDWPDEDLYARDLNYSDYY